MPLIFWTKMNDIRSALWLFSSAGRLKTIHPSPSNSLRSLTTPPFSPLYLMVVRRFDGVLPQNETRSLGFTCHRWGVSFRFAPVFPFLRWTLIRIKTKPTALVLLGWSNRFCHKTSL
ncbi:hypothetical protein J4727_20220 [Providencia rettgeri]|uniref:Uncharacterized protein n=1 Tax=Providencia rettgeri TaxID=587 RepID=A0A939SR87_PRORE|nr:hypothetical protein [Providencia rettgeri]